MRVSSVVASAARRPALVNQVLEQFRSTPRMGRFVVKDVRPIDEFNLCAVQLVHEPTQAEVLHMCRPDNNNAFVVSLSTPPEKDTGITHILEHTVLCGSRNYPTRDPFFKMLNRSLANFMNALTGPDYTMYPFSTTNAQDYANLLRVYLDSVFFPKLDQHDFRQEGWRLEHENVHDISSPIQFKGVVFNEMKGVFSSSDNLYWMRSNQLLRPTSIYQYVSGGEPLAITDLTWDALKNFHEQHYHPSNAKLLTYGDINVEQHLDVMEETVLKHFDHRQPPTAESMVPAWDAPRSEHITCAHDPNGGDKQTKMSTSFLTRDRLDVYESFCLRMLSALLLDSSSSPFYLALIDSGIAPEFSPDTGLSTHAPQASFSIGVMGIGDDQVDHVSDVISKTLNKHAEEPFDDEMVQALLHQIEIQQRNVGSSFGRGLCMSVGRDWNHGHDPFSLLETRPIIDRFRREYSEDPMFFQSLVRRHLIDNPHRLDLVMSPSGSYQQERDAEEKEKLDSLVAEMTAEDKQQLYDDNLFLLAEQQKQRDVSCLPTLHVGDISRTGTYYDPDLSAKDPFQLYTNVQPTNGVCYTRAFFGGEALPYEDQMYLPLFNQMLTTAGVGDITYKEFPQKVQNCMDDLSAASVVARDFFHPERFTHGVSVTSHCLQDRAGDSFSLWRRMLTEARLTDHHHLRNILRMAAADVVPMIADRGHQYAVGLASSQHSDASRLSDAHAGLTHFKFVKDLNAALEAGDTTIEEVASRLTNIRDKLLTIPNTRAMMTADDDAMSAALPLFKDVFSSLSSTSSTADAAPLVMGHGPYAADNHKAAIVFPFNVSYAGCTVPTVPPSDPASAHLSLATSIMTTFLHREIREKGGAYGAGCGYSSGSVRYMTYRDPTPLRSLEKFAEATEWMLNEGFSDDQVDEAKLTCFQSIDAPIDVGARGSGYFISQVPREAREKRRHAVLDATKSDILQAVEKHLSVDTLKNASTGLLIPPDIAGDVRAAGMRVFQAEQEQHA